MFCGKSGQGLSREHVVPNWIGKVLPGVGNFTHRLDIDGGSPKFAYSARDMDFKAKIVCMSCNNGWMSGIEDRVIPILTPLLNGEARELTSTEQRSVALWACKTAMVFAHAGGILPAGLKESCRWIYKHLTPSPGSHCWLGRFADVDTDLDLRTYKFHTVPIEMTRPSQPDVRHSALVWTAGIGQLAVINLTMPTGLGRSDVTVGGVPAEWLHPVWPNDDNNITWPPPLTLSEEHLRAISRNFESRQK
jgi:hypothetical protein